MEALTFWVGEWDCTWSDGHGTNRVTIEYDGHVVVERFESLTPDRFTGFSVSVPNRDGGRWRQTWVDSTGNYWHFVGGPEPDGTFVFVTPEPVDEEQVFKRMVFSNLTPGGFDWRWEFSTDTNVWETTWQIRYTRRSAAGADRAPR
jgi:hypothetical protein